LDDAFEALRSEMRDMRAEMRDMRTEMHAEVRDLRSDISKLWMTMVGGYTTILAALVGLIALHI
jgi:hypothetical protein